MANKAPAIKSKVINYEYVDGIKIEVKGSDTIAIRQSLYQKSYDLVNSPVIIPPSIPQQTDTKVRTISIQELANTKGLSNQSVQVAKGNYNDQYWLTDFKDVNIDLSLCQFGTTDMPVFELKGLVDGVYIKGGKFIGTTHSAFKLRETGNNITLDGLYFEKSGSAFEGDGSIDDAGFKNVCSNFKLINSKAYDCPDIGTIVRIGMADNYLIQNNVFDKINANTNIHNGICYIAGNGKVIGNVLTNHQGNLLRSQPMQVLGNDKTVEISNNIVWNSRKYGAFEVQVYAFQRTQAFSPADVIIKNNTAGDLNTSKDWVGKLVDVYDNYSNITVSKNLGFNLVESTNRPIISLVNFAGVSDKSTVVTETESVYKPTKDEAIDINLKSKISGIGAAL